MREWPTDFAAVRLSRPPAQLSAAMPALGTRWLTSLTGRYVGSTASQGRHHPQRPHLQAGVTVHTNHAVTSPPALLTPVPVARLDANR